MQIVKSNQLAEILDYDSLIQSLKKAFVDPNLEMPSRHHYYFGGENQHSLLLMPSWSNGKYLGVKIITVCPENGKALKPTIQGNYLLFDANDGTPLVQTDAKLLTLLRTAACSALASTFLSRRDSKTLLMIGTGSLAPYLVQAHCAVRPIKKVYIWGRNFMKAERVRDYLGKHGLDVQAVEHLDGIVPECDIISTATMSEDPLLQGDWVKPGTHVDLVGSYLPTMREADDALIRKSSIYVDDYDSANKESGDLVIPRRKGILRKAQMKGSLFELCRMERVGRTTNTEITVFKSVGLALEDLAAAGLIYERLDKKE